jgi:ABC-type phosphate transport system permease subunit
MTQPSPSPPALDKVEIIQSSLRCFTHGLIGLLPGLGIPFAAVAIANFFRVKARVGAQWNPAQRYLVWGLATALAGTFLTVVLAVVIASIIVLDLAKSSD